MRREVFVFHEPCDMRKSFDGLYGLVREMDPLPGSIFLFLSKDRKRAKSLHWGGTGLVIRGRTQQKKWPRRKSSIQLILLP